MDFIGKRKIWFVISTIVILISISALFYNQFFRGSVLNFGIDFTGGTVLNMRLGKQVEAKDVTAVRSILKYYKYRDASLQTTENTDITIRTEPLTQTQRTQIFNHIKEKYPKLELLEADTIGPVIGEELRTQAIWALIIATLGIIIYVTFRFQFVYALAALVALYHDTIIMLGFVALFWQSVDSSFIAAILTIMGYSINDTIVIFDRIRENLSLPGRGKKSFADIINESVNQTLSRSINTVLTVVFMNLAILLWGGATLKGFALILLVGFTVGGYSSIFVASPVVYMLSRYASKK